MSCKAHQRGYLFGEHYDYIVGSKKDLKNADVLADQVERETLGIPNFVQNYFINN